MRIIRCDRCGGENERSLFQEATLQYYEKQPQGGHDQKTVDICPKCFGAFMSWMKGPDK